MSKGKNIENKNVESKSVESKIVEDENFSFSYYIQCYSSSLRESTVEKECISS